MVRAVGSGSLDWRRQPVYSTPLGNKDPALALPTSSELLPVLPLAKPNWNPEGKSSIGVTHTSQPPGTQKGRRVESGNGRDAA